MASLETTPSTNKKNKRIKLREKKWNRLEKIFSTWLIILSQFKIKLCKNYSDRSKTIQIIVIKSLNSDNCYKEFENEIKNNGCYFFFKKGALVSYVNSEATRYFSSVLVVLSNYIHISMICFDFFLTFSCHNKKKILVHFNQHPWMKKHILIECNINFFKLIRK